MKTCRTCGRELPATLEFFGPRKERPCGLRSKCRECSREAGRAPKHGESVHAWYVAHREQALAYSRAYYAENLQTMRQQHAAYHAADPSATMARVRKRRALLKGSTGAHTAADVAAQCTRQKGRCFWCHEKLVEPTVDHVVPLSGGGGNGSENLVIACEHCNKSKGAKSPMDWAGVML